MCMYKSYKTIMSVPLRMFKLRQGYKKVSLVLITLSVIVFICCHLPQRGRRVTIAFASCGDRNEESLVLIKSAILLTKEIIDFYVFTDSKLYFWRELKSLQLESRIPFSYFIYDVSFPNDKEVPMDIWKELFMPCASQRLFLPNILRDVDAVLYVDTDVLFVTPPEDLWNLFKKFNSTQSVGVAPEQLDGDSGHYDDSPMPVYGKKGVNSGVMLLNLTRIRGRYWHPDLVNFYVKYKNLIRVGDQDLLNIYYHFNPEIVFTFPCELNYRPDFCNKTITCKQAPRILHGNRRAGHLANPEFRQPVYRVIYLAMKNHRLQHPAVNLLGTVCNGLRQVNGSRCGRAAHLFIEELSHSLDDQYFDNRPECSPEFLNKH